MPVISLPEYLGISEAPQQPVFQRTRQVEPDSPWARTMQVADSLTALRNQRPMAQIQAIQNEYDMIRENAEKLRREREAAMQAEQAVSSLAGLTPDSPDYLNQRKQIMTRFPSAILDPRVQSIMDDSDRMYNARQQAEARRQEEITTRAAELAGVGIDANEAMRLAQQGAIAASGAKYQATRKPDKDTALADRQKYVDFLGSQIDRMQKNEMAEIETTDDKGNTTYAPNPVFASLVKQYNDALVGLNQPMSQGQVQETATAVKPAAAPTAAPEPAGGFKEKMKGATPTITPPAQTPTPEVNLEEAAKREQMQNISEMNEDGLVRIIESDTYSLRDKEQALSMLKTLEKKRIPGLTKNQVEQKRKAIAENIAKVEPLVQSARLYEKEIAPAYGKAMSDIETMVEMYADQNNLDPSNVYSTIAEGAMGKLMSPETATLINDVLGSKTAYQENQQMKKVLEKEKTLKDASQPIRSWFKSLFGGYSASNADILVRLAKERTGGRITPGWGEKTQAMDVGLESSSEADEIARRYLP